ncbi:MULTISPECIES: nucleoside 2-deoxyribosyltransferase, partial [unclassified Afipia]|uniref:nucleoside 2-deoxyribosyltransferase n=1 Tax=unclassified Afipia TaxID=2642050 RepID=UPI0004667FC7
RGRFRGAGHGLWIISFVMTHAEVAKPNRVYLANPLGFSEAGSEFIRRVLLPELTNRGFQVINPFDLVDLSKIREIQAMPIGSARIDAWKALNAVIGKTNQETIDSCDVVLAVLDGTDVDSGTAAEIGYAYARGKKIMGYRGDFRLSADNEGSSVNLQVEYFIRSSGGTVVTKSSDIGDAMWALVKKN